MKNNTKLIMETWRRFLNESDQDDPRMYDSENPMPQGEPVVDEHLSSEDPYNFDDISSEESLYDDDYEDLPGDRPGDFETMHDEIDDLVRQGMPRDQIEAKYPSFSKEALDAIYDNFHDMQTLASEERDALNDPDVDEFGNERDNPFYYDDGPY